MNTVTIQFADAIDARNFLNYCAKAKAQEGTVGSLYAGLMCSALKRATVTQNKTDQKQSTKGD